MVDQHGHPGADVVRLVAVDGTGGPGGWLAFTGPASIPFSPLQDYIRAGAAVGTAWQIAFNFPCQRQPVVRNGITEPVSYGVVWGGGGENGLTDSTWQVIRGGLFAPVRRTSSVALLVARFPAAPQVTTVQVYRFVLPYPTDAYRLGGQRLVRFGWEGP
jgi:arabinosyltransferase C